MVFLCVQFPALSILISSHAAAAKPIYKWKVIFSGFPVQSTGTIYRVCTQHTDMCPIWPEGNQMCNSILAGVAETDWNIICRGVGNCDANMKSRGIIIITIIIWMWVIECTTDLMNIHYWDTPTDSHAHIHLRTLGWVHMFISPFGLMWLLAPRCTALLIPQKFMDSLCAVVVVVVGGACHMPEDNNAIIHQIKTSTTWWWFWSCCCWC